MKSTGTAIRVAVIDDDVSIREALTALLKSCGYETAAFASAAEIMSLGAHNDFACLLIDMYMPEMTGLELLRWLNASKAASRAILMSSEASPNLNLEALRFGAYAFLEKSLGYERLIEAVDQVVRGGG